MDHGAMMRVILDHLHRHDGPSPNNDGSGFNTYGMFMEPYDDEGQPVMWIRARPGGVEGWEILDYECSYLD